MVFSKTSDIEVAHFQLLLQHKKNINHFVTTRYNNLDLGLNPSKDQQFIIRNREKLANSLGLKVDSFIFQNQIHDTHVAIVTQDDSGKGVYSADTAVKQTDALITQAKGVCLITLSADCVPLLFFDPQHMAIGVAHAGWKGTVKRIGYHVVQSMKAAFHTKPEELLVAIGPSAGPCCYEVGEDVLTEAGKAFDLQHVTTHNKKNQTIFNLWEANKLALIEGGVNPNNIECSEICTICENQQFFSARCNDSGRFAAGIFIE